MDVNRLQGCAASIDNHPFPFRLYPSVHECQDPFLQMLIAMPLIVQAIATPSWPVDLIYTTTAVYIRSISNLNVDVNCLKP
eukprot:m.113513 g.113513  ORF g.113513 m.113513 type:complete len:81 (+) comp28277_c0_seq1:1083-1325(+)